jgi:uncharacterized membrane protein
MFGYLIEWAEVICGVILILAAPVIFVCLNKKPAMQKTAAVLSILSLAGILLMSLNFYWMTGATTVLPGGNAYIPGVSFDFFIVILSLVLIVWNATLLNRKERVKISEWQPE